MLWMCLIFFLSHQDDLQSSRTSGMLVWLLSFFGLGQEFIDAYHIRWWIRKAAHFTEYFVLYLLIKRVLNLYEAYIPRAAYAWIFTAGYAMTDELHQRFIPGRTGLFQDVMIDSSGALTALGLLWLYEQWQMKKM
ncbi:MAG: VanZ family protein [Bacteroidota bacterium]